MKKSNRRTFIRNSALAGAGMYAFSASSYSNIVGANERVNLAVAGLNGRGKAHISAARNLGSKAKVIALCDVDNRVFTKVQQEYGDFLDKKVDTFEDIREVLDHKDVDAITVATPDHWHAPMGNNGHASRETRISRKTLLSQSQRRRIVDGGSASNRQETSNWQPAKIIHHL